jgi:hypothetical protein
MPDTSDVMLVAPRRHRSSAVDQLPEGLLEWLLDGKVLRAGRIREARDRLASGCQPDAYEVAAAVLQETGPAMR